MGYTGRRHGKAAGMSIIYIDMNIRYMGATITTHHAVHIGISYACMIIFYYIIDIDMLPIIIGHREHVIIITPYTFNTH